MAGLKIFVAVVVMMLVVKNNVGLSCSLHGRTSGSPQSSTPISEDSTSAPRETPVPCDSSFGPCSNGQNQIASNPPGSSSFSQYNSVPTSYPSVPGLPVIPILPGSSYNRDQLSNYVNPNYLPLPSIPVDMPVSQALPSTGPFDYGSLPIPSPLSDAYPYDGPIKVVKPIILLLVPGSGSSDPGSLRILPTPPSTPQQINIPTPIAVPTTTYATSPVEVLSTVSETASKSVPLPNDIPESIPVNSPTDIAIPDPTVVSTSDSPIQSIAVPVTNIVSDSVSTTAPPS